MIISLLFISPLRRLLTAPNNDYPVLYAFYPPVFTRRRRGDKTTATFTLRHAEGVKNVEVIGDNRTIAVKDGVFKDDFEAWDVHLYRTK